MTEPADDAIAVDLEDLVPVLQEQVVELLNQNAMLKAAVRKLQRDAAALTNGEVKEVVPHGPST